MVITQISERIYYLPFDENTDGPNLGYILGNKYSIMIDCGNSPKHLSLFYAGLEERHLPIPQIAFITHWHWDHTFGMNSFNGTTIAGQLTNNKLKEVMQWKWTDKAMKERLVNGEEIKFCDENIRKEYKNLSEICVKSADVIFDRSISIDLGGITCTALHCQSPHSKDSVIIYVPEEKILFCGDADSGDFYDNKGQREVGRVKQYRDVLMKIPFEVYLHGHCEPLSREQVFIDLEEMMGGNEN